LVPLAPEIRKQFKKNRRILTIHSTGVNRFLTNCHRRLPGFRQWYPGPTRLTYTFNWDNKLRKAEWPGNNSIQLKYDPLGNRVYKKSTASGSATGRKYIVDPFGILDITGELPVILMDLNLTDSSLKKKYIYGDPRYWHSTPATIWLRGISICVTGSAASG